MKFCGNGFERRFLARSLLYNKPTKKKKKIVFALENPETVLEWRCERSSCGFYVMRMSCWGATVLFCILTFVLVDSISHQACFFIYLPCTQWTL